MRSINLLIIISAYISITSCSMQIKNATTETVKINGNCAMCKSAIEIAGSVKNVVLVDWNKDTKMATLTYDSIKTNQQEILKRIALAGYDSEHFLAPDDEYARLPDCCKYDRLNTSQIATIDRMPEHAMPGKNSDSIHSTEKKPDTKEQTKQEIKHLKALFNSYFALKDALVQSDPNVALEKAKNLSASIKAVVMSQLSKEEHTVWMEVMDDLALDALKISESKDIAKQRDPFMSLSKNMYSLMKASKQESAVYYQHCPMANDGKGANWLSKENEIRNPYYGASMLTCGKTVETLK